MNDAATQELIRKALANPTPCSKCGITGLHACPGEPIPPMTAEEKQKFNDAFAKVFGIK